MNWNSFFGIKPQKYLEAEPDSRPDGANVCQPDTIGKDGRRIVYANTTNIKCPPSYDLSGKVKKKNLIRLNERQLSDLLINGECVADGIVIIGSMSIDSDYLNHVAKIGLNDNIRYC